MLFIQAIGKCVWRVLSEISGALGTLIAAAGTAAEFLGLKTVMPNWGWIAIGAALLFITAVRIERELMEEREKNRKPIPDMKLEDVMKRIRGKSDIFGPEHSETAEVAKAFRLIEERAAVGAITVFGAKGVRFVPPSEHVDFVLRRLPIHVDEWSKCSFDYSAFVSDRHGRVTDETRPHGELGAGYGYIWFDSKQINSIWPRPRRKIALRNPFRFKETLE